MAGLDDLIGGLTKGSGGGQSSGLEDLLGGLLGSGAQGGGQSGTGAGGLGDMLGGLLGGGGQSRGGAGLAGALAPLLGGLLAGGGLQKLLESFRSNGLSAQADSWVATGENEPVTGREVSQALADDGAVQRLAAAAGITEGEAAEVLAQVVPQVVNGLTPDGQVPSDDELHKLLDAVGQR